MSKKDEDLNKKLNKLLYVGSKKAFESTYNIEIPENPTPEKIQKLMSETFARNFALISKDLSKTISEYLSDIEINHNLKLGTSITDGKLDGKIWIEK